MAWKPSTPQRIALFDRAMSAVEGALRREQFGCPGYFAGGKVFAILQSDQVILRLSDEDAEALRKAGGRSWTPMPGRPSRAYVIVPEAVLSAPERLRPWIRKSAAFARTLGAKPAKKSR